MKPGDDYEQFCTASWPRLVSGLAHYFGDRQLAEDAAQEALIRAGVSWTRVGALASPLGWTFRVGTNMGISELRRRTAERRAVGRLEVDPSPNLAIDVETSSLLHRALAALTPQQRRVIVARFYFGLSVEETASTLAMSNRAVRAASHRGMETLRSRLSPMFTLAEEGQS